MAATAAAICAAWSGWMSHGRQQELSLGHDLILEIDVQGCLQVMAQDASVTGSRSSGALSPAARTAAGTSTPGVSGVRTRR